MTNPNYTHLAMVVDRSGSMQGMAAEANAAIRELLKAQAEEPGEILVDITTFDGDIEYPYVGVDPLDVEGDVIEPRGTTALLDALGRTINLLGSRLAKLEEDERPAHVIFVVVTDGHENASQEYSRAQIKAMITEQTDKWGWTFMYLAANVDAFATGGDMGFAKGSTISYAGTGLGTQSVYGAASRSVSNIRAGQSGDFTEDDRDSAAAS